METLKKEKLEAERRAEEEQKAKEKRKEDERVAKELKEKEEAMEHKWLEDLKEQEDKEKEDEANEVALQAAGALLVSDGDSEVDLVHSKMATMDELRRRHRITKRKNKAEGPESQKCKIHSASRVEESEDEAGGASAGLLTPKRLKTEPAPQANDNVFSGNGA